jgi:hypothetical protein
MLQNKPAAYKNGFSLLAGIIVWFAVIAQFVLMIENRTAPVTETVIRFFSFFTILSNIAVACCFTAVLAPPKSLLARLLNRAGSQSAVTVYILVVGVVYNLVLRAIWHPEGMQRIVDEMLHVISPLLMLWYWIRFTEKSDLHTGMALRWLAFPFLYTVFIAVRGAVSGFYPYPFLNVPVIGYPRAILNGMVLLAFFILLNLLLIFIAKKIRKSTVTTG